MLNQIDVGVATAKDMIEDALGKTLVSNGLFGSCKHMENNYLKRALGAAKGLYGNSLEEAWYEGFVADGKLLGVLRLAAGQLQPSKFFWSITLYTLPERYLYPNKRQFFSIGDRTTHLTYGEDDSLETVGSRWLMETAFFGIAGGKE